MKLKKFLKLIKTEYICIEFSGYGERIFSKTEEIMDSLFYIQNLKDKKVLEVDALIERHKMGMEKLYDMKKYNSENTIFVRVQDEEE